MGFSAIRRIEPVPLHSTGNYPYGPLLWGFGTHLWRYYDRLDFFWIHVRNSPNTIQEYFRIDPLFLSNTGSLYDNLGDPPLIGAITSRSLYVGDWDRAAGVQRLYQGPSAATGAAGERFRELNVLAYAGVLQDDPFPLVGPDTTRSGVTSTTPGYYTAAADGGWHFFEKWGFAFNARATLRHTDGVTYIGVPILVNLTTGLATLVATPTSYGSVSHKFAGPELFAQIVDFDYAQFTPDDASTPATPVGVFWLVHRPPSSNPNDTTLQREWLKVIDWNPFGISSTPSRVHLRERLISAFDFLESNFAALNGIASTSVNGSFLVHPRTNRLLFWAQATTVSSPIVAGDTKWIEINLTPAFSYLTEPAPYSEVATGKTILFAAEARGSLGERIAGKSVSFQLRRVSTVKETLATTGTPGETVTVANAMSPTDAAVAPVSVYENGVPLVEGVAFTVNRATSQITFIAPKPLAGAVYQATYRHFGVTATPAHGTLLVAASQTGIDGLALTQVRYPEEANVPDRWDRLDADPI